MTSIPLLRNNNNTESEGYNPISLLPLTQKIMQKLVPSNNSPQKSQCTMRLHIYRKQWKTGSYTWAFLDIEGASDSTSCDITKTAKWHGLRDTLPMDWLHAERQKNSATIVREHCTVYKSFSTCINILCVGKPHISRNDPIHTAAPPPLSAHHTGLPNAPDSNLLQSKINKRDCNLLLHQPSNL